MASEAHYRKRAVEAQLAIIRTLAKYFNVEEISLPPRNYRGDVFNATMRWEVLAKWIQKTVEHGVLPHDEVVETFVDGVAPDVFPKDLTDHTVEELAQLAEDFKLEVVPTGKNDNTLKADYVKALTDYASEHLNADGN